MSLKGLQGPPKKLRMCKLMHFPISSSPCCTSQAAWESACFLSRFFYLQCGAAHVRKGTLPLSSMWLHSGARRIAWYKAGPFQGFG
eukprot:517813-Pelagomonas_calceolata.AAC.2